jgi:hypothetical protein
MHDLPQHIYRLIVAVVGRNQWVNVKPVLHRSLPQFAALMAKLSPPFQSLAQSSA